MLEFIVCFDEVGSHVTMLLIAKPNQTGQFLEAVRTWHDVGRVVSVQCFGGLVTP